jgi:hypothetical protein
MADVYVEVWCESRSIASVILEDCEELGVSLYPSGGFASLTLPYDAAQQISWSVEDTDRSIWIVYVGDHDPAGVLIDIDIEVKLRKHLMDDFGVMNQLKFHRLAITDDQISTYGLPTKPRKRGEKRARHIVETVEAEAMPAHILRQLLRERIESFMPKGARGQGGGRIRTRGATADSGVYRPWSIKGVARSPPSRRRSALGSFWQQIGPLKQDKAPILRHLNSMGSVEGVNAAPCAQAEGSESSRPP